MWGWTIYTGTILVLCISSVTSSNGDAKCTQDTGAAVISVDTAYRSGHDGLFLECQSRSSNGGDPYRLFHKDVTTVRWYENGVLIQRDNPHYVQHGFRLQMTSLPEIIGVNYTCDILLSESGVCYQGTAFINIQETCDVAHCFDQMRYGQVSGGHWNTLGEREAPMFLMLVGGLVVVVAIAVVCVVSTKIKFRKSFVSKKLQDSLLKDGKTFEVKDETHEGFENPEMSEKSRTLHGTMIPMIDEKTTSFQNHSENKLQRVTDKKAPTNPKDAMVTVKADINKNDDLTTTNGDANNALQRRNDAQQTTEKPSNLHTHGNQRYQVKETDIDADLEDQHDSQSPLSTSV